MNSQLLVAAHLSSVFHSSTHVTTHAVPTSRRDIPLPPLPNNPSSPNDHASFSSVSHTSITDHVLIRIIQGGLVVELISLSKPAAPIRFVFPATVLPSPALVVHAENEVHLLAVTSVGSLYRIVLPLHDGSQLWNGPLGRSWCREWCIRKLVVNQPQLVHVQSSSCVAVALSSGSYIRLDADGVSANSGEVASCCAVTFTAHRLTQLQIGARSSAGPQGGLSLCCQRFILVRCNRQK
jgi:nuclear pore complex protein Nup160